MERVYDALKQRIMRGEVAPGARLDPVRLASALNASSTPVRDALHRLVGERMVRSWPHDGFHAPLHTELALRDLYAWHHDLMTIVIRSARAQRKESPGLHEHDVFSGPSQPPDGEALAAAAGSLFGAIGQLSENLEYRQAIANANDRLHIVRLAEADTLTDSANELRELVALFSARAFDELRKSIATYHRRRISAVPKIVAIMRAEAGRSEV